MSESTVQEVFNLQHMALVQLRDMTKELFEMLNRLEDEHAKTREAVRDLQIAETARRMREKQ